MWNTHIDVEYGYFFFFYKIHPYAQVITTPVTLVLIHPESHKPVEPVSTSRMWSAISDARFSDGAGIMSTVSVSGRLLRASSRLPASIMGTKWPTPQTGTKTTVGSALVMFGSDSGWNGRKADERGAE